MVFNGIYSPRNSLIKASALVIPFCLKDIIGNLDEEGCFCFRRLTMDIKVQLNYVCVCVCPLNAFTLAHQCGNSALCIVELFELWLCFKCRLLSQL